MSEAREQDPLKESGQQAKLEVLAPGCDAFSCYFTLYKMKTKLPTQYFEKEIKL